MRQRLEHAMEIRKYLLGEMSDTEQSQLEERLLTDKNYFHEFLQMEESLTDEYVIGGLTEEERERFETYFMKAPERRESVEFASALGRYISRAQEQATARAKEDEWILPAAPSRWRSNATVIAGLAFVVLLLAACTTWLAIKADRLSKEVEQTRREQSRMNQLEEDLRRLNEQQASAAQLARQLDEVRAKLGETEQKLMKLSQAARLRYGNSPSTVMSAVLVPGLDRSEGQPQQVNISRGASRLLLRLLVEGKYRSYSAEIKTVEGQQIFSKDQLKDHKVKGGRAVLVELPTTIIKDGDYLVEMSGVAESRHEKLRTYQFRVVRR